MRRLTREVARMAFEDCSFRSDAQAHPGNRELIDGTDYPKVMKFSELSQLTPEEVAEEDSDAECFIEDSERFNGQNIPIFDKCVCAIQVGMPNTMEEIWELFQQSKSRKADLDQAKCDTEECQGKLDETQQDLKEALALRVLQDDKSEAIRVHEMALIDKRMKLEEMRLSTFQLEKEILKSQSEGGGGPDKHAGWGDSEIHMFTTSREDDYFVRGANKWDQWVKLSVNIREHPSRWNADRIFRQLFHRRGDEGGHCVAATRSIRQNQTLPREAGGF